MSSGSLPKPGGQSQVHQERIPFYRNVRTLALLTQLIFVVVAVGGIYVLYRNVSTGLASSNLTFTFGYLDDRAGFDLGETPIPFSSSNSYFRAIVVGFLNTLKVGLAGIVLCSILGVTVGTMRLSANWLLRTLATGYVELLRNTPLAVQLIFWYYAVILSVPPRSDNAIRLPGDIYVSQIGIGLPWLYPSYNFRLWLPWLLVAVVAAAAAYVWRRRRLIQADRPGNLWLLPLLVFALVSAAGYLFADVRAQAHEQVAASVEASRGTGVVFHDENGDGQLGPGERTAPYTPIVVTIPEARLEATSQNLSESREAIYSSFRFARIDDHEYSSAEVSFRDPEAAEGLSLHFTEFPSIGNIYRDVNGNGRFDEGEQFYTEDGIVRAFNGLRLVMHLEGFQRRLVSDRSGQVRMPIFRTAPDESEAVSPAGGGAGGLGGGLGGLFEPPAQQAAEIEVETAFPAPGPLVYSAPTVPRSEYFGGTRLTTPFLALLLGLAIYTSSFVAEIVRAGLQAVPKGQSEAAKALGLSGGQTFYLVVFPQALRIIIPPVISQYLNLTKNSSLAILVTFSDFFQVSNTVGNQTGQFVSVYVIILLGYLLLSLVFSLILNIVNARLALVER